MRPVLFALVCVTLCPALFSAQDKTAPVARADATAAAIASICDGNSSNLISLLNCGFEYGDFTNWSVGGDPSFVGIDTNTVNSGSNAASFGAIGDFNILRTTWQLCCFNYHIEFWLTNPNGGSGTEVIVTWFPGSGDDPVTLLDLADSDPFDWTLYTFGPLPARANDAYLSFAFRHDPSFFYFDDVDLELVFLDGSAAAAPPAGHRSVRLTPGGTFARLTAASQHPAGLGGQPNALARFGLVAPADAFRSFVQKVKHPIPPHPRRRTR